MAGWTMFDKIWAAHLVTQDADGVALLYIDLHLIHELHPMALSKLRDAGRRIRRPGQTLAIADHIVPTVPDWATALAADGPGAHMVSLLGQVAAAQGVTYFGPGDPNQGIVHVVAPELGRSLPGMTIVCGDSHTSTHGAFGALAFGIGTSEVEHVMATQTLRQTKPRTMRVTFVGTPGTGTTAKDLALLLIGRIGVAGATGHAVEFAGPAVRALSMEGRMTLCNMAIEAGARSGMVAPDETTFAYLEATPDRPRGAMWERALAYWRTLPSDADARFDTEVVVDVAGLAPQVTWGTSPEQVAAVDGVVPDPALLDPAKRAAAERALAYMDLQPGTRLTAIAINTVFIGSCTNARIEDLRAAAAVVGGRRIAPGIVRALVVPGSNRVKQQAEAEGLDRIFRAAGFDWRGAGCSMCLAMNGDRLHAGDRCAATFNRNFEGRQGAGGRVHLMSPELAAASALAGHIADPRLAP